MSEQKEREVANFMREWFWMGADYAKEQWKAEREALIKELRDRELHHFEAEKALSDLLTLSYSITRDSHCSHLGADIRALIPNDITGVPIQ